MTPEENFARLQLTLPPSPEPLGVYKPFLVDGSYVYVSGHGPLISKGNFIIGRIG
jgi:enamine deaminase RidA (YjgF/YER057c/UK114 family)